MNGFFGAIHSGQSLFISYQLNVLDMVFVDLLTRISFKFKMYSLNISKSL